MKLELEGRTAVVTGASKGIGLAVARALRAEGAQVVAGARSGSEELTALTTGGGAVEVLGDFTTAEGCAALTDAAVAGTATRRFTRPDEVAQVVLLLASETAGNVTGADVLIDGGMVTTL